MIVYHGLMDSMQVAGLRGGIRIQGLTFQK
jgi:hypothetical protein